MSNTVPASDPLIETPVDTTSPAYRYRLTRWTGDVSKEDMGEGVVSLKDLTTLRPALVAADQSLRESMIDTDGAWREGQNLIKHTRDTMKEVFCRSLLKWGTELRTRQALGHVLLPCDDPRARCIAFVDDTTNEVFNLGLVGLKEATTEDYTAVGMVRGPKGSFATSAGRDRLITGDRDVDLSFAWELILHEERPRDIGLSQLVTAEVEQEFSAHRELDNLDEFIIRPIR